MKKFLFAFFVFGVSIFMLPASSFAAFPRYSDIKPKIQENRAVADQNREDFQDSYDGEKIEIVQSLSTLQKEELRDIEAAFTAEMAQFDGLIKNAPNFKAREEIYSEMKEVVAEYYGKINYIVASSETATQYVEDKYALFQTNEELREDTRNIRHKYVKEIQEIIDTLLAQ